MKKVNFILLQDHSPPERNASMKNLALKKYYMKYSLILFAAFVCFSASYGQLTQNNWLVGGSGSFYSYNEDYTAPSVNVTAKYTSIDLSASVGYFFFDKFSGGLRPYFSSLKGESSGGGTTNSYRMAIGPFIRYYLLNFDKPFNILTDLSYQIGVNKWLDGYPSKGKFNNLTIMAGTEVFFNSTAGMEILIGYRNQIASIDNSPSAYHRKKKWLAGIYRHYPTLRKKLKNIF